MFANREVAHFFLLFSSFVMLTITTAWHSCGADGGICPDGNKCCVDASGSIKTYCISGKNETQGDCFCSGEPIGCGDSYSCSEDATGPYCWSVNPLDETLPEIVPPYQLLSIKDRVLKQVYGLPMRDKNNSSKLDKTNQAQSNAGTSVVAAYLSTTGALDSQEPAILAEQAKIETAWIVVHGSARNVDDYICCSAAAVGENKIDSTMILTPWFLAPHDRVNSSSSSVHQDGYADDTSNNSNSTFARWAERGPIPHTWRYGANAIGTDVSSYAVLDEMIERFLVDTTRFPALQRIVIAGHSAGGQTVQRWALLTSGNSAFGNPATGYVPRVPTRVVVANPKSFCWLDERRVFNGTLRKPQDDAIGICLSYNEWEWGFSNSTKTSERDELKSPYFHQAVRDAGGIDAIVARYPFRDVVYLAGALDVLHNGDCEAKMQGLYRRARSANFFASLQKIYGRAVHHRLVVPGVPHDHCLMFQSPQGKKALFGSFEDTKQVWSL